MIKKMTLGAVFCFVATLTAFAQTKTAVFHFADNPWNVEVATSGDEPEVGKLEDGKELVIEDVALSGVKHHARYWNRIYNDHYTIYPKNHVLFTVPNKYLITRIDFVHKTWSGDLEVARGGGVYDADEETEDNHHYWEGETSQLELMATTSSAIFRKITVHYKDNPAVGIQPLVVKESPSDVVYNLWGKAVATRATFATLPAGIYVINGNKVQK